MRNSQTWHQTVRTGAIILLPTLAGFFLDWLFQMTVWTFVGATFTVFELAERLLERSITNATQFCCPNKLAGYQDYEELDSNDFGH